MRAANKFYDSDIHPISGWIAITADDLSTDVKKIFPSIKILSRVIHNVK